MDKNHLKFEGISNRQFIEDQLDVNSATASSYIHNSFNAIPEACLPQIRAKPLAKECLWLVDYTNSEQCTNAITPPSIGLIERGDVLIDFNQRIKLFSQYNLVGFSVTSQTASEHNFAPYLSTLAQTHFDISNKALPSITLAIQEAAINALTHGNLGLLSPFQETGDNLSLYYELIRARSRHNTFKNRRLDLFAWATEDSVFTAIKDQGEGYKPLAPSSQSPIVERRKSGRGLDIIRQFSDDYWLSAKGTSIVLRFVK